MKTSPFIDENTAKTIGDKLAVNFNAFGLDEFMEAMNNEIGAALKAGEVKSNEVITEQELEGIGRLTLAHTNQYVD